MKICVFYITQWKVKINRSKYRSSDSLTLDFNALPRTIDNLEMHIFKLLDIIFLFNTFTQKVGFLCCLACGNTRFLFSSLMYDMHESTYQNKFPSKSFQHNFFYEAVVLLRKFYCYMNKRNN